MKPELPGKPAGPESDGFLPDANPVGENIEWDAEPDPLQDPGLVQQITRTQRDGMDQVVAYYRCRFESGQQRQALNVLIQPAMSIAPEVHVNVVDGHEARVRVTDIERYGLRAELVLAQTPDGPVQVLVEVLATAPCESKQ